MYITDVLRWQSTTPEALQRWNRFQSSLNLKHRTPSLQADAAVAAAGLKLPIATGSPSKKGDNTRATTFKTAKYAEFAKKLEKLNPSVVLNKQLTDDAFRASFNKIARLTPSLSAAKEMDRVCQHSCYCLRRG